MKHTFTTKQILNITTGVGHTGMDDIYDFFNKVIEDGIMTHMLPNAFKAIQPIMHRILPDVPKEGYHPDIENVEISFEFTDEDKAEFWKNYGDLPSLLAGKKVITISVD